jgi:hypothetical protein
MSFKASHTRLSLFIETGTSKSSKRCRNQTQNTKHKMKRISINIETKLRSISKKRGNKEYIKRERQRNRERKKNETVIQRVEIIGISETNTHCLKKFQRERTLL